MPLMLNTGKYFTTKAVYFLICPVGNVSIFTTWVCAFNCRSVTVLLSNELVTAITGENHKEFDGQLVCLILGWVWNSVHGCLSFLCWIQQALRLAIP